jgi:hypothetical protein
MDDAPAGKIGVTAKDYYHRVTEDTENKIALAAGRQGN